MSNDLDRRLTAALQAHAGGDVDPAPIVALARRRGGRLRLRRRVLAGAAAVCAVLVALAAVVPVQPAPDIPAEPPATLALPVVPGEPGALERPGVVGADPRLVHFSAAAVIGDAGHATWRTGRGTESVESSQTARFVLATTVAALDALPVYLESVGPPQPPVDVLVGDRPGTARPAPAGGDADLWSVRWQPGDGLWAQLELYAADRDAAAAAAARVTFTGAHRCVVPFRLETLPAGARVLGCSVTLVNAVPGGFAEGALVVGDGAGRSLTIRAERTPAGIEARAGELVAGAYQVNRAATGVLEMLVQPCLVDLFLAELGSSGYTEPDGLTVLGGYRPFPDLEHPDTW